MQIEIEGVALEALRKLSRPDQDALLSFARPISFTMGSATVLAEFNRDGPELIVNLAHIDGAPPQPGQALVETSDPDQPCGMIVQAAVAPSGGYDALVELKLAAREANDVRLGAADGPALAFAELPYDIFDPTESPASSASSATVS